MNNHTETTGNISEFLPMMPARAMAASPRRRATVLPTREQVAKPTTKNTVAAGFFLALYLAVYLGGGFAVIQGIAKVFHTSAW